MRFRRRRHDPLGFAHRYADDARTPTVAIPALSQGPTWRVGALSKQVLSRLISVLQKEAQFGDMRLISLENGVLTKSPDPASMA